MVQKAATDGGTFSLNLTTEGIGKPLAHIHSRGIKSKLYEALFGKRSRMMIIVPEECVRSITFTPLDDDGGKTEERDG